MGFLSKGWQILHRQRVEEGKLAVDGGGRRQLRTLKEGSRHGFGRSEGERG